MSGVLDSRSVSVVIPSYNRADLLPRAISSALDQTCTPAEVIVVDDGSSDDTPARCREWGERIRYMRVPNGGVAAARNAGIAAARGEWVALLDSDDTWEPTKLEVQLTAHRAAPTAPWSLTGCELVDGLGRARSGPQSFKGAFPLFRDYGHDPDELFARYLQRFDVHSAGQSHICYRGDLFGLLFLGNVGLPSSALIRREFLAQLGGFDGSLRMAEETEFFHRAAAHAPVVIIMSPLVRYRAVQGDSLTASSNTVALTELALRSLDAATAHRPMNGAYSKERLEGRRNLLLRLAYAHLTMRDGSCVRQSLRRLRNDGLPLGHRGTALWAASLLPASVLAGLHRAKQLWHRAGESKQ